ncbi:hypothetical protein C0J52_27546 [Blattella germanica]|nr:hypothetical protein C0J52_27546 [Blattella germanica]
MKMSLFSTNFSQFYTLDVRQTRSSFNHLVPPHLSLASWHFPQILYLQSKRKIFFRNTLYAYLASS